MHPFMHNYSICSQLVAKQPGAFIQPSSKTRCLCLASPCCSRVRTSLWSVMRIHERCAKMHNSLRGTATMQIAFHLCDTTCPPVVHVGHHGQHRQSRDLASIDRRHIPDEWEEVLPCQRGVVLDERRQICIHKVARRFQRGLSMFGAAAEFGSFSSFHVFDAG